MLIILMKLQTVSTYILGNIFDGKFTHILSNVFPKLIIFLNIEQQLRKSTYVFHIEKV